ncbi:multiple sugar transport system substrate-binding protein [Nakamurella sp. UYEF19]|uniref:extracellular solute-binding protein n=1 Tax=Nakamurella sp. UYEF19 TaxID=1756392 RepID=UPI003399F898
MAVRTYQRLVATSLAVALAVTMTSCAKGSSSQSDSGGSTLTLWTHNAGNAAELASINAIVTDYNSSQKNYQVKVQAFPQDSYNQSVTAAAAAKKLPCILDVDAPNVPNWAWAKYLAPLTGLDDTLSKFLPSTVGKWNSATYSFGYYDVSLTMVSRKSVLEANGIRIPTIDKPWTAAEFSAGLDKIKAGGKFKYALDLGTSATGEWWPYAYSPLLQSFGGDLINRTDFTSADKTLNGAAAVKWATWFRSMITGGFAPLKSGADPIADFGNGVSAILWSGQWSAVPLVKKFGDDVVFLPPVDFGNGPKIGGGSWQWAVSSGCANQAGAMDYMKFASQDKYVASVATATFNIPATDAAAAVVKGYEKGGAYDIFRQYSKKFATIRPPTPGYPFIATEFTKTAQDILNGADPKTELDQAVLDIDANQKSNNNFS